MNKTILFVEDDPAVRNLFSLIIEPAFPECSFIFAENGRKALEILEDMGDLKLDLIISDIRMPEMCGISFRKELEKCSEKKHIPFAFLSGTVGDVKAQFPGISVLSKPIEFKDLIEFVKQSLAGDRASLPFADETKR